MEPKKSKKVDLESQRKIFFQIGIAITLVVIIFIFSWATPISKSKWEIENKVNYIEDELIVQRTQTELPKPPEPKPQINMTDYEQVKNTEKEDDFNKTLETDEKDKVQITDYTNTKKIEEDQDDSDEIFVTVEEMPEYPGGEIALRTFISQTIIYPELAKENGIQGTVYVRFMVSKTGTIEQVQVIKGIDPLLNEESLRVTKLMKNWKPGKNYNKPVNVWYTIPIKFKLN